MRTLKKLKFLVLIFLLFTSFAFAEDAFYQKIIQKENSLQVPEIAKTYYFQHLKKPKKVILLIHGYTCNPLETKNLGRYLYHKGFDAFGIRLAGHGTKPQDLKKTTYQDWYRSTEEAYLFLQKKYREVYVFGVSAGALSALKLAKKYPVSSLVLEAPFLIPQNKLIYVLTLIYPIFKIFDCNLGYIKANIPESRSAITYTYNPLETTLQLVYFAKNSKHELKKVKCPVLILHSPVDDVADPKGSWFIYKNIRSQNKVLIFCGKEHSFLIDYNKEYFDLVGNFLENIK